MRSLTLATFAQYYRQFFGIASLSVYIWMIAPLPAQAPFPLLPIPRRLETPPMVVETGTIVSFARPRAAIPLTAALAVTDLRLYDDQLATLFPPSASAYPIDSLRILKRSRAKAWLVRLESTAGMGIAGPQLLDFAEVAMRAEADTVAQQAIERRLAQLPPGLAGAVQRSVALSAAVMLFADATQDSARLAKNLAVATTYASQLAALFPTGYPSQSDSTDVLYRKLDAQYALVRAADALQQPAQVLSAAERMLGVITHLRMQERRSIVLHQYPYLEVATAMTTQPHGRARLDSLNAQLLTLGARRSRDAAYGAPDTVRQGGELVGWQHMLQARFAAFALLGQPAPPVSAHAWLNTPDSVYAESARVHPFTDGRVRVLAFGGMRDKRLPALERLHQHFPTGLQVVFITETDGHVGPDIVSPSAEVTWLASYYEVKRHLMFPIAIWAGAKVRGDYGASQPVPSPVKLAYRRGWTPGVCVIDARGIVRAYQEIDTREQEAALMQRIRMLLAERR